jgi:hypothetical protein
MFNYDAEKKIFSISFDSENLCAEAIEAVNKVIENFFGEKAFYAMSNDDYTNLYNSILDSIKIKR